jgi:hypothetical protein
MGNSYVILQFHQRKGMVRFDINVQTSTDLGIWNEMLTSQILNSPMRIPAPNAKKLLCR